MRIGHYAPKIWAEGGIATYIRRLGEAQAGAGRDVVYFGNAHEAGGGTNDFIGVEGAADLFRRAEGLRLDVLHLHKPVDVLPPSPVPVVRVVHGNGASCPSATRFLTRQQTPCPRAYSVSGCLWGHLVDHCGSRHPQNIRADFRQIRHQMRQIPRMPTYTVSQFLKSQMIRAGYNEDQLQVLRSPAPDVQEAFRPPPSDGPPRFAFLGRLVPHKGLGWLLRALAQTNTDVRLDVAGEGYAREAMQRLTEQLGLTSKVTFHGWVPPEAAKQLIEAARAVVFPSLWHEPAGLVTLEAAAYGRPVIASRVGGIPEYALDDYSLLVQPNDINGLAEALERLATDYTLAEKMGRDGRDAVRRYFSMRTFLDELDALYHRTTRDNLLQA